ncbi:hypothetical protein QNO07_07225 [Streptomyces sp. 549]|uniref:hypothetical protein n=1 Tax=Streptomyces sp. 549 TaxID=3049076 RepID=UPI0024C25D4C|nr:hypothetical protein [Streptomyces sp. 549]MDK1473215.1 hypothetical protein [Streptomyces sp. 549]
MKMNTLKRRLPRVMAIAAALVLVVTLLLHTSAKTNVLGDDYFCDGSLSADDVREAFGVPGRFIDEPGDPFACTIKKSNLGFGDDDATIYLEIVSGEPNFPLFMGQWEVGANVRMASLGEGIAVREDRGWALLPAACRLGDASKANRGEFRLLIKASSHEASPDQLGLARLLSTLRTGWTEQLHCASGDTRPSSELALQPSSTKEDSDPARLCSLPGFSMGTTDRDPVATRQQTSGSFASDWFCDVALKEPDPHISRDDLYLQFAAVRNSDLVQGFKDKEPEVNCDGAPVHLLIDVPGYPLDRAGSIKHGVVEIWTLYQRFVEAVAAREGCTRV